MNRGVFIFRFCFSAKIGNLAMGLIPIMLNVTNLFKKKDKLRIIVWQQVIPLLELQRNLSYSLQHARKHTFVRTEVIPVRCETLKP